ncbi:HAD-IIIC family phosphatase [Paenibacillus hunanensis]|uniref:HAD-IIIC family phosphatase n=1 Tax=Paenibacillus hunanensis TaxID=539262 RepID=UPI00202645F8|nr:HAD-IIIC family phosphatase [Paenibacillus hunanensis]MCL9662462.1 HAD-IIIC family phosphatase [Paenibacillus hunanensis]
MQPIKMLLLSDWNLNPMVRFLAKSSNGIKIEAKEAPYNQVHQLLMNLNHPLWTEDLDAHLIWTSPESMIPSFQKVLDYEPVDMGQIIKEVDAFCDMLIPSTMKSRFVFLVSWSVPPHYRWIQTLMNKHNTGLNNILMQMNLRVAERLNEHKSVVILDSTYWYAAIQKKSYDIKMYAIGKIPFSRDLFVLVSEEIQAVIQGLLGQSKKLIICDLDNTLWGGIIGDDGMENIKLGGIDPIGESFKEFQRELKRLANRGVLLAISSKNNEQIALEMIEQHPEMVLKKRDFSAFRINWQDKAQNILEIVEELHLGLQSVVFLDDNPIERDRVKRALPEIYVPDLPEDFTQYPIFIHTLNCFETSSITEEDRDRAKWFQVEQQRQEEKKLVGSLENWLSSLELKVKVTKLNESVLPRAVQLLNKTNQFNMATRRFTPEDYWIWSNQAHHSVFVFEVEDKFGTAGYTALISLSKHESEQVEIEDFVMSCRVMGKGIEEVILYYAKIATGSSRLKTKYTKTSKNQPFFDFIKDKYVKGSTVWLDNDQIQKPNYITLIEE